MSSGSWVLCNYSVSSLVVEFEDGGFFGEGLVAYLNPSIGAACVEIQVDDLRRSTNLHASQIQSVVLVFDLHDISTAEPFTKKEDPNIQQLRQDDWAQVHPPS
jgi:hypothetical protein